MFGGAEQAGIKIHAAIDTEISRNHIYHTSRGLWLDWMAQGARVSRNLLHDNLDEDLFVEVNHGPFVVDNNLFLSRISLLDWSEGGAYAHNLFTGRIVSRPELGRQTPWHPAHSTVVASLSNIKGGDNRYYNNIFVGVAATPTAAFAGDIYEPSKSVGHGLWVYDHREFPLQTGGNVYLNGARPYKAESAALVVPETVRVTLTEAPSGKFQINFSPPTALAQAATKMVTTKWLGRARVPNLPYENADGTRLKVDTDFFGKRRDTTPTPGPFENPGFGPIQLE